MSPLSVEVRAQLEKAVATAEQGTSGEVVVVVAPRSASYAAARASFALACAVVTGLAAIALHVHAGWALLAWPIVAVAAFSIASTPWLLRALVDDDDRAAAVADAAKIAFFDRGVHTTRERAGVLLYLSLAERRVQILADAGVHRVVGRTGWEAHVAQIAGALRAGYPAEIVGVVAAIGAVLARHFPRTADDANELPDAVQPTPRTPG
jgi:putative membrane protein